MSVGHLARLIEEAGISTVVIASAVFEDRLKAMSIPRGLLTPHIMGRPLGAPGDQDERDRIIRKALAILEQADHNPTIEIL